VFDRAIYPRQGFFILKQGGKKWMLASSDSMALVRSAV